MTRTENKQLSAMEYEQGLTVLRSRPQFLVLELTQGCNLSCPMCRTTSISVSESKIASIDFEDVANELFPTAEVVDLRGWGESLILPDITDFITRTSAAGCRVRFVSNLSFRRQRVLECLIQHRVLLTCSIDAADPEVLGRIRKGSRLVTILENLKYLTRLSADPDAITVLCTLQKRSLPSLPELPNLLADAGVRQLHFAAVSSRDPEVALNFSCDYARAQVQKVIAECARLSINVKLATSLPGLTVTPMPRCMRPWTTMHISVDGRIGYCDHLIGPFAESQLIGRISDGILNVWNCERWQQIRQAHNKMQPRFKKCVKCYRDKGTDFEDMWLGKKWA